MKRYIIAPLLVAAAASLTSCVEMHPGDLEDGARETRQQSIVVVPEFTITGADSLPESLFLSEMELAVSEIRLEPTSGGPQNLAYSTREPIVVNFDIDRGQTSVAEGPIELPSAGRYLVSIRLEPVQVGDEDPRSFEMSGFVAETVEARTIDEGDGTPFPMPFEKQDGAIDGSLSDRPAYPSEWTPFRYHSKLAVFFTFDDVEFSPGEQFLTFTFDVRDWGVDVIDPISRAVRNSPGGNEEGVDVTRQVESTGNGVNALIRTGVVQTARQPGGHP